MAHTDLLIFFNTAFWVFFLFIIIYFIILSVFSSNTYYRVRIYSLHRVFLMTCLLSFFQLGVILNKTLQYFVVFYKNFFILSFKSFYINNYINNCVYSFSRVKKFFNSNKLTNLGTTYFSYFY